MPESTGVFLSVLIRRNLRCAIKFYAIIPKDNLNDPRNPKHYSVKLDLRGINFLSRPKNSAVLKSDVAPMATSVLLAFALASCMFMEGFVTLIRAIKARLSFLLYLQ